MGLRVGRRGAALVAGVGVAGALAAVVASAGGDTHSRQVQPAAPPRPEATRDLPVDVVAPRLAHLATGRDRLSGVVFDPGSGVRRIHLWLDGRRLKTVRGDCRRTCAASARFTLDRIAPPAGDARAVSITSVDLAGNEALLWQRLSVAEARDTKTTLTAAALIQPGGLSAHTHYALHGRLTRSTGAPLVGAPVELLALARISRAEPDRVAVVKTDTAGRWRVGDLRGFDGSRSYVARHLDGSGEGVASEPVETTVPVPLAARLAADRQSVVGHVRAAAPRRAIGVLLALRRGGRWRTVDRGRLGTGGRFALPLPARARGSVAVFVAPHPNLPYAPAGRVVDLARP